MGNQVVVKSATSKQISDQDLLFLKSATKLSEEAIRGMYDEFWTEFPSGKVDKKGFIKYYEQFKQSNDQKNVLYDHVFAVFDKDHNGTLDFHELVLTLAAGTPSDLDSRLNYVFEMCDVSGDGQMDLSELATFLSASLTLKGITDQTGNYEPKRLATTVFRFLGVSPDKKLTKQQFVEGCKRTPELRQLFTDGV